MSELEIIEWPRGKVWEWTAPSGTRCQYRLKYVDCLYFYTQIGGEWFMSSTPPRRVPEGARPRDVARSLIAPAGSSALIAPCWNGWCIAHDCDGPEHVDVTGRTWTEVRPDDLPEGERLSVRVYGTDTEES